MKNIDNALTEFDKLHYANDLDEYISQINTMNSKKDDNFLIEQGLSILEQEGLLFHNIIRDLIADSRKDMGPAIEMSKLLDTYSKGHNLHEDLDNYNNIKKRMREESNKNGCLRKIITTLDNAMGGQDFW